jgi:hypothetical protein
MKNTLLILLISMVSACEIDNQADASSPIKEVNAVFHNNNLPVDGCAEHISLVDAKEDLIKSVLPTDITKPLFAKLMDSEVAKLPADTYSGNLNISVVLKYKETQEKGELLCGWGHKSVVEQIEIISISKR